MVEVRLPAEIAGRKLAALIENSEKKVLKPRGYEIKKRTHNESYYPSGSTNLVTIEVARTIDAIKELDGGNKQHWGWVHIYTGDSALVSSYDLDWGKPPKLNLKENYGSLHLFVAEHHVTPYSSWNLIVEPSGKGFKKYRSDMQSLIRELNRELKIIAK